MFKILDVAGTKLIFSHMTGITTASLGVFINTGARYEHKNTKGVAHFLEHMIFKGSHKYSYREIKRQIEGRGGILNGFTSQEITAYYAQCLSKNIDKTLDILLDMVQTPLLERKEIEKERNVILEEIKMNNDLPHIRAESLLDGLLWENHPLGEEVSGYLNTINRIRGDDISAFKRKFYFPRNMVIVCTLASGENKLLDKIKTRIMPVTSAARNPQNSKPSSLRGVRVVIEEKKIDQTHLYLGFRGPSYRSPQRLSAELIHVILGANMSSRLFEEIREKKALCYDISTEVRKFKDSGSFCVHLGLNSKNITVALKSILRQLSIIKNKLVGSKELERAKDYLFGQIVMNTERPVGKMFYLADSYLALNKIYTLEEIKGLIQGITSQKIRDTSRSIFDFGNMRFSCVTGAKDGLEHKITKIANQRY